MLEGQVAVLTSGYLSVKESIEVLDALKASKMYRTDQYSYMLYPNRELARFTDKNNIPEQFSSQSHLFKQLNSADNHALVVKDIDGVFHFNGKIRNADELADALDSLSDYQAEVKQERNSILDLWESMYNHREFTGRSGSFFGYEGLGSIYWHMVSKLLFAINETYYAAVEQKADAIDISKLTEHYYEVRAGIGLNKSPELYGAFPTDPYSHTPAHAGAQQPGMTGQVKEDILSRFGELGVFVKNGKLEFNPALLRESEFLKTSKEFNYINNEGDKQEITLKSNELAFTYCRIPIVYHLSEKEEINIVFNNNETKRVDALVLDEEMSKSIFTRKGEIKQLDVYLSVGLS